MKKIKIFLVIAGLAVFTVFQPAQAGTKHYTLVSGEKDFYFGFISYLPEEPGVRAPEIFRPGLSVPETAQLNFPLAPGDVVLTYDQPCEIQFDSGTIIRLGTNSQLKIETILAQTLSSGDQLSNLELRKGTLYLMYTAYNSWEIFQLITPTSALKMKNHTVILTQVAENGETRVTVKEGKGNLLFGPSSDRLKSIAIKKGESVLVTADHQVEKRESFPELADFEAWNKELNKNFLELHKGITPLPKPIQKLPPAVFYFAQNYSNQYGQWLWDEFYGYVWRPYYNDVYPWGNWSPYIYGRWTYVNSSLFWVPEEPWGWVPYHLGIWQWDKKLGWVWIPGSVFAPAWADWDFFFGLYSWRPWTMMDWLFYDYYGAGYDYGYYGGMTGGVAGQGSGQLPELKYINKIRKDQLKKPQTSSFPVPGEYKSILKNLSKAIDRGNPEIVERITVRPPEPVVVKREDLGSSNLVQRIIPAREVFKRLNQGKTPQNQKSPAVRTPGAEKLAIFDYLKARTPVTSLKAGEKTNQGSRIGAGEKTQVFQPDSRTDNWVQPSRVNSAAIRIAAAFTMRFRDWNPDLRVAKQLGVHVLYDSPRNSVVSPELGLNSREARQMRLRLTSEGVVKVGPWEGTSSGYISSSPNTSSAPASQPRMAPAEKSSEASSNKQSSSGRTKGH
jgi:hypothetical protein